MGGGSSKQDVQNSAGTGFTGGLVPDNATKEDLDAYLEERGRQYAYYCLKENNPEACHSLAQFYNLYVRDGKRAMETYRKNCDERHYGESCLNFGNAVLEGVSGLEQNTQTAFQYFAKGCEEGNHARSCLSAAMMLTSSFMSNAPRYVEALPYLQRGCKLGLTSCCFHISTLYMADKVPTATPAEKWAKVLDYSLQSCEMGHFVACHNLSIMYKNGDGVEKSETKAAEYRQKTKELHEKYQAGESANDPLMLNTTYHKLEDRKQSKK